MSRLDDSKNEQDNWAITNKTKKILEQDLIVELVKLFNW